MSAKRILLARMRAAVEQLRARAALAPVGSRERDVVLECLGLVTKAYGGAVDLRDASPTLPPAPPALPPSRSSPSSRVQ